MRYVYPRLENTANKQYTILFPTACPLLASLHAETWLWESQGNIVSYFAHLCEKCLSKQCLLIRSRAQETRQGHNVSYSLPTFRKRYGCGKHCFLVCPPPGMANNTLNSTQNNVNFAHVGGTWLTIILTLLKIMLTLPMHVGETWLTIFLTLLKIMLTLPMHVGET